MANDPYWNSVVLAMHMDDAGLTDLKGHTVTLNGNAARSATQSKFGGYSAYFDGTGDYLSVPQLIGSVAFTIEAWVRVAAATEQAFFAQYSINNGRLSLCLNASGKLEFFIGSTPNLSIADAATFPTNAFVHIAVSRDAAGTTRLFRDGVLVAYGSSDQAIDAVSCSIGGQYSTTYALQRPMTGYIDDLRVTDGIARYTADFSVPTEAFPNTPPQLIGTVTDANGNPASRPVIAIPRNRASVSYATISDATTGAFTLPAYDGSEHTVIALPVEGDPYWDNVVLALHMDGANGPTTFTDEKGHTVTDYDGGAQISTAQSTFGGASAYFDGVDASNTRLEIADSDDWHFDGAYTVEMFVNMSVQKTTAICLIQQGQIAGGVFCPLRIDITADGKVVILGSSDNSAWNSVTYNSGFVFTSSTALGTDQWYHIAIGDDGKTCRLFIDGVCESSRPTWTKTNFAYPLLIGGAYSSGDREFNGYIDDIRITKGVARYIHDFTPPSSAFPHAITGGTENALILDNITPV